MRTSRRLSAAVALTAALGLSACTSDPETVPVAAPSPSPTGQSPVGALYAAAALTELAGSGRYALRTSTVLNGQEVVLTGDGILDWVNDKGRTTYRIPVGPVEQRMLGGTLFFVLPQQAGVFFSVPSAQVAATPLGATVDPTAQLAVLAAASDVERLDEQEVRDVMTTRYRGVYDVATAVNAADGLQKDALRASFGGQTVTQVPFEAWIDEQGLVRRLEQVVEVTPAGGAPVTVTTTLELYDFGYDVVVPGPPAEAIRDGAPLLEAIRTALPRPAAPASPAPAPAVPAPPAPSPGG